MKNVSGHKVNNDNWDAVAKQTSNNDFISICKIEIYCTLNSTHHAYFVETQGNHYNWRCQTCALTQLPTA